MVAAAHEREPRAVEQVAGRRADEDLARPGERGDARGGVDGESAGLAAGDRDLARVEPGPDRDVEVGDRPDHRAGAAHGAGGAVEQGEEPVAGRAHLAAAEAVELRPDPAVVLEERAAARRGRRAGSSGRGGVDDVGEEDRREHGLVVLVRVGCRTVRRS